MSRKTFKIADDIPTQSFFVSRKVCGYYMGNVILVGKEHHRLVINEQWDKDFVQRKEGRKEGSDSKKFSTILFYPSLGNFLAPCKIVNCTPFFGVLAICLSNLQNNTTLNFVT